MQDLAIDDDSAWEFWRHQWSLRTDTVYLNHGSFGPPSLPVQGAQQACKARLDSQPMDFFVREYELRWRQARRKLAEFVGSPPEDLVFVENATQAMNVVAHSFPLHTGDEVLLTDHEYGAVERIWRRRCEQTGAILRVANLPQPIESSEQLIAAVVGEITDRTRLLVASHITSPTAVILPVAELCAAARQQGVSTCIDGPHAPAQIAFCLAELGCDFYAASCHKWLSAPFGSGFLYVAPRWQSSIAPPQLSWGLLRPAKPQRWDDEFLWTGTRDPSAYLAVPAAIDFLEQVGMGLFRRRTHWLAQYARRTLTEFATREPLVPDCESWYGSMAHMPLPNVNAPQLQQSLWQRYGIEVPIIDWSGSSWIRVSCHLYNRKSDIDLLAAALRALV